MVFKNQSWSLLCKILIDLFCWIFVLALANILYSLKPFERGFFLDDNDIKQPYRKSTVPMLFQIVFDNVLCLIIVGITEFIRRRNYNGSSLKLFNVSIPVWLWNVCAFVAVFQFGQQVVMLIVTVGKITIGRLRPYFWQVCLPTYNASDVIMNYVSKYECSSGIASVTELKLSFPSGHSAEASYTAIYLIIYLQYKMLWSGSVMTRVLLQVLLKTSSWFIALSRRMDNHHHWDDILCGYAIGIILGLFMILKVAEVHKSSQSQSDDKFNKGTTSSNDDDNLTQLKSV